jgi:hypothetical protein
MKAKKKDVPREKRTHQRRRAVQVYGCPDGPLPTQHRERVTSPKVGVGVKVQNGLTQGETDIRAKWFTEEIAPEEQEQGGVRRRHNGKGKQGTWGAGRIRSTPRRNQHRGRARRGSGSLRRRWSQDTCRFRHEASTGGAT